MRAHPPVGVANAKPPKSKPPNQHTSEANSKTRNSNPSLLQVAVTCLRNQRKSVLLPKKVVDTLDPEPCTLNPKP